jgi:hypothetical protein
MANTDNPNGFKFVKSLYGEAILDTVTLAGTVAKGDALVFSAGTCTILLSNSSLVHGVAAEAGVSGDDILFYPALPGYVFEAQCSGTYVKATYLHTDVDIEGATGIQEINEDATTEKVAHIVGINSNSEVGAYSRLWVTFPRSSYTSLEDAE